jgi:hypothetical protein
MAACGVRARHVALEERVEEVRALTRSRLELMYRPELDTLSEPGAQCRVDRARGADGLGLLGPHARALRPLLRPGLQRVDRGDRAPAAADSRLFESPDTNRARPDAGGPVDHEALLQRNASATACTISSLP